MKECLIIFAKEPKAGKVKTRLQEYFSKKDCLSLYKAFLKDTLDIARSVKCFCRILAYDSPFSQPRYLKTIAGDFTFYKQEGKNLGRKMYNAFKFSKRLGFDKAVIIGSDSPNLPLKYLAQAYNRLNKSDVVLGPSCDGGYYLIGLKEPCAGIFNNIKWSSQSVFGVTLRKAKDIGKKVSVLEKWYDIDDFKGLGFLKKDLAKNKKAGLWTRKELGI